jgi:N-acetyltransferase 10
LQAIESGDAEEKYDATKVTRQTLETHISVFDLKRLESYSNNLVDFHLIMDLVPSIAKLYF